MFEFFPVCVPVRVGLVRVRFRVCVRVRFPVLVFVGVRVRVRVCVRVCMFELEYFLLFFSFATTLNQFLISFSYHFLVTNFI